MKRAIERSKLDRETNIELVETMWKQFSNLGIYELNVIDTTTHSIKDTVSAVQEKIASKRTTLVEESELTHVAAPDNPTKEFENRQERFALYRAMQQLDAETREVIHLRLAGDFSFRDIGDILGHSEVWARVRFYRGKEKLVKIIGGCQLNNDAISFQLPLTWNLAKSAIVRSTISRVLDTTIDFLLKRANQCLCLPLFCSRYTVCDLL